MEFDLLVDFGLSRTQFYVSGMQHSLVRASRTSYEVCAKTEEREESASLVCGCLSKNPCSLVRLCEND